MRISDWSSDVCSSDLFDDATTLDITRDMAGRAVRLFPALARLRLVRTWGALRVLPPDKFPIYEESAAHPGAYVATMHSGVTLAAEIGRASCRERVCQYV